MLLKSLAALALAAQASALSVGVYTDSACTSANLELRALASDKTCVRASSSTYVAVAGCQSSPTMTTVAIGPSSTCNGGFTYSGSITTSCTALTATGTNPARWAKIESSIDSSCGDATKSYMTNYFADASCATDTGAFDSVIADGVCRYYGPMGSPPTTYYMKSAVSGGLVSVSAYTDTSCATTAAFTFGGISPNGACKAISPVINSIAGVKATLANPFPPAPTTSGASETATAAAVVVGAAAAIAMAARA